MAFFKVSAFLHSNCPHTCIQTKAQTHESNFDRRSKPIKHCGPALCHPCSPNCALIENLRAYAQPESLHGITATGLSMEAQTVVQRMQLLGFNAVRLPFTFAELAKDPPRNYSASCQHPSPAQVSRRFQAQILGGD